MRAKAVLAIPYPTPTRYLKRRCQKKGPSERALSVCNEKRNYGIVLLARFDKSLSTPVEVKDLTAKYHVPEPRPVTM